MENSPPTSSSRWLSFPRVLWVSLAVTLALCLMVPRASFIVDDFISLGILGGVTPPAPIANSALDLYRTADPSLVPALMQKGVFPWWTVSELTVAFWRPLSSALIVMDRALFGTEPMGYHVHSVLWYLGLVALVGGLLWRVLPGAVGALALLLFAIDDSHVASVAWLSQRSTVVSMAFALAGVLLHLEWRERRRGWALPLSVLGLALGLAGGETALIVLSYLVAYELMGTQGRASERLRALAPAALLVLVYAVVRDRLGYGTAGSDMYMNPFTQPWHWLKAALLWVPMNLGGVLLNVPVDFGSEPRFVNALVGAGLAGMVMVGLMLRAVWPDLSEPERRHVRWLLAGSFLSTWVASTTIPTTRTLMVPSLGSAVAIAVVLHHAWRRRARSWRGGALVTGAALLVLLHVLAAPYIWWQTVELYRGLAGSNERIQKMFSEQLDIERLPGQRVVMVNVPHAVVGLYASVQWWATGKPLPLSWRVLSFATGEHRVTRTGPSTLELELEKGRFMTSIFERIHRSSLSPLAAGQEVALEGMTVKVLEADGEGVSKLSFTFDVPLEDPSLVLFHWKHRKLQRFVPPPLGDGVSLNAQAVP